MSTPTNTVVAELSDFVKNKLILYQKVAKQPTTIKLGSPKHFMLLDCI